MKVLHNNDENLHDSHIYEFYTVRMVCSYFINHKGNREEVFSVEDQIHLKSSVLNLTHLLPFLLF